MEWNGIERISGCPSTLRQPRKVSVVEGLVFGHMHTISLDQLCSKFKIERPAKQNNAMDFFDSEFV